VPSIARFRATLEAVRADEVAEARGEYLADVDSVAAPIRSASGSVVAAVDVSAPSSRFGASRASLRCQVRSAAERISEQLHQLGVNDLTT
jgi:DNA-binding IclR family transcriptional regulator